MDDRNKYSRTGSKNTDLKYRLVCAPLSLFQYLVWMDTPREPVWDIFKGIRTIKHDLQKLLLCLLITLKTTGLNYCFSHYDPKQQWEVTLWILKLHQKDFSRPTALCSSEWSLSELCHDFFLSTLSKTKTIIIWLNWANQIHSAALSLNHRTVSYSGFAI